MALTPSPCGEFKTFKTFKTLKTFKTPKLRSLAFSLLKVLSFEFETQTYRVLKVLMVLILKVLKVLNTTFKTLTVGSQVLNFKTQNLGLGTSYSPNRCQHIPSQTINILALLAEYRPPWVSGSEY